MAGLLDNLLKNLSNPQTLGLLGSHLMAAGAQSTDPGNVWKQLSNFAPNLQAMRDSELERKYRTMQIGDLERAQSGRKSFLDFLTGGGGTPSQQPQAGAQPGAGNSIAPGESGGMPDEILRQMGIGPGYREPDIMPAMRGVGASASGGDWAQSLPPSMRGFIQAYAQMDPEGAARMISDLVNQPTYETVQNPYGDTTPGVGQRNVRTGQITGFQEADKPDRRVLGHQYVEFGPNGPKVLYDAPNTGGGGGQGSGLLAGKTQTERMMNILLDGMQTGKTDSPSYRAAYTFMSKPQVSWDANTGQAMMVTPDLSWAQPPGGPSGPTGALSAAPGATPGTPTIAPIDGPQKGVSADRATFEANINQAKSDLKTVSDIFFPGDKFDRQAAVTGAANTPWTRGREGRQAVRRTVEIMLRLRTGAAAPDSEVNNYTSMFAPSALDTEDGAKRKLALLKKFFDDSEREALSRFGSGGSDGQTGDGSRYEIIEVSP